MTDLQTKPTIELRGIKHSASLSEETPAYTATLLVNGVVFGEVSNHGQGGSDEFHSKVHSYKDLKALDDLVASTYPKVEAFGMELTESVEMLCHGIVYEEQERKNLRSMLSRKFLYIKADGVYTVAKAKGKEAAHLSALKGKNPTAVFLNEMAFDDAFAAFKKATAE